MIAQYLASDERETSLLVKTGSRQEAMKIQKYMSDQLYNSNGLLIEFNKTLISHWTIGKFYTICFEDDLEALEAAEKCIWNYVNRMNESYYDDEPSPFETYEAYVASDMEDILNERGIRGRGHDKYLDTLDKSLPIRKELRRFFDEDVEEEEAAERLIDLIDKKDINEDFSMGVEGPTGLNQGIPHGGPGKGVIPAPLFGKGKIVTRDDDKKKLKKALDVLDVYGVKVKKTKKVSEDAMPEWFCRNPWTVDDVDHYLYHDLGFDGGETDDIITANWDLIHELLEKGKSPEEVADALDYSTVQNEED